MDRLHLTRPQQLCAGYVLLHALTHLSAGWFEVQPGISISIWYPPAGLALALLVLLGPRYAPIVFLANFATAWTGIAAHALWTALFFPGLLTAIYGTAAWLVRRHLGPRLLPGGTRETLVFFATIAGAPLVAALIGTAVSEALRAPLATTTLPQFLHSVREWWIGDASGLITVVPVVMVFVGPWLAGQQGLADWFPQGARAAGLAALRGAALMGTLALVLLVPALREHRAFYLCFLPLVWICVHHGLPGATLATLSVMVVGLIGMRLAGTTIDYSYIFLLFELAVAGVGLGLGTMVTRRNEAEERLATQNAELARLHRLELDEKIAAKLAEEKARLEVLRYQLNPHFLYNALNSIYGLVYENAREAGEVVLRLSEFCRATLTGSIDEQPTLAAELATLRPYLEVEKARWGERLQIELQSATEAERIRLPPLLLLPLVENAIKYGSRTTSGTLRLSIRTFIEERNGAIGSKHAPDALVIEIANSGKWLPPDPSRTDSTGIGLENLRQRLQRHFPDAHEFTIGAENDWVVARVRILPIPNPAPPTPANLHATA